MPIGYIEPWNEGSLVINNKIAQSIERVGFDCITLANDLDLAKFSVFDF